MTLQICSFGLRSVELWTRILTGIQNYVRGTNQALFESCDLERSFTRRLHFRFGRQTPCNGASDRNDVQIE